MGWVVSATLRPLLSPGMMPGTHCNNAGWAEIQVSLYSVVRTLSKWQSSFDFVYHRRRQVTVPVAARAEIVGSNPTRGMDICLL
jgi:hypothetical protein